MAGGRKKKSSGAKKNKARGRNGSGAASGSAKKPLPLEDVLDRAESALETSHVDSALELFGRAAGILRSRVHAPAAAGDAGAAADGIDRDRATLSAVLGKMGELRASGGDAEAARADFSDAIRLLGPAAGAADGGDAEMSSKEDGECNVGAAQGSESRASLHLYLGQLSSGGEALASFRVGVGELERAVRVLERILDAGDGAEDAEMEGSGEAGGGAPRRFLVETRRQLCAAHCSIAELYLTDLCEEPDAETLCEEALRSALASDEASSMDVSGYGDDGHQPAPPLPDALQTMANFRLSQSRVPEALECILKAYDRMKVGCEAMAALVGLGHADGNGKLGDVEVESKSRELLEVDAASSLPEYNFRCQTVKIMLECASLLENCDATINQCAESAIQVLGSLLAENDEVIEVWYLLGCAFMACTPPNAESAHYYWENSLTMLTKAKESLEQSFGDGDDDDIENEIEVMECQIIDVQKKLGTYVEEDDDDDEEEEDEDMEDDS